MDNLDLFLMSKQEIERYGVIRQLRAGKINGTVAAKMMRLSVRQTKRLKKREAKHGAKGLVHGSRGKTSHNKTGKKECQKIISIIKKNYSDFTPTFAAEKLSECHNINHDRKTIEAIMIEDGFWEKKRKKKKEAHRAWRERRAVYGEMEQFDGSYHDWFEGRGGFDELCLLASIDDANGTITHAKFDQSEGVYPVFGFWQEYLLRHGKPLSVYLDKFSTYHMNIGLVKDNSDTKTQFGRAMENDLKINLITAHSPESKGRIERLFQTLQDRLVKELRLHKISDIDKANEFLLKFFIPDFNKRFAVSARTKGDSHRPLSKLEENNLSAIFCRHEKRIVGSDFTIAYKKNWLQLIKGQPVTVVKKDAVIIEEQIDETIKIRLRGKHLNYIVLPERPKKVSAKKQPWVLAATNQFSNKPLADHPWRLKMNSEILRAKLLKV